MAMYSCGNCLEMFTAEPDLDGTVCCPECRTLVPHKSPASIPKESAEALSEIATEVDEPVEKECFESDYYAMAGAEHLAFFPNSIGQVNFAVRTFVFLILKILLSVVTALICHETLDALVPLALVGLIVLRVLEIFAVDLPRVRDAGMSKSILVLALSPITDPILFLFLLLKPSKQHRQVKVR